MSSAADAGQAAITAAAGGTAAGAGNAFWLPVYTLTKRELVRFLRQRNRVMSALVQPIIFFFLFGQAFNGSFAPPGGYPGTYQDYFFPGAIVMILLFTAIFSTVSIIEDRKEGFLQSVLVAPVPRLAIVLGKLFGGMILAVLQASVFVVGMCVLRGAVPLATLPLLLGTMALVAFALTGLGFLMAWRLDSTQGFHAVMMLFLMPMWLLSGAFFPAAGAPAWLQWAITLNPLSYGLAAVRRLLQPEQALPDVPALGVALAVTAGFAVVTTVLCVLASRQRTAGDLH